VPYVLCVNNEGGFDVVWAHGRAPLNAGREYLWAGAFSWDNDKAVVPTRNGISILTFGTHIDESYRELRIAPVALDASKNSAKTPPQVLFDGQGILTWVPWEHGRPGSEGALRYLKDQWIDMGPEQGWPEKLVHLVPLRDGTVFQFTVGKDGSITVQTAALETTPIDESAIEKLVAQLSDIDADVRRTAVSELANYGPGAWPSLTRLAEDQPPQAKLLLREILKDKNHPTLSGMTLLGSQSLQLVTHLSDGGVVFYAAQGVSIPDLNGDPVTFAPAWLSVRPGHFVELLPATLVADLKPDDGGLDVIGDQWIANTNTQGPRLFYGNGFATLLRKSERQFSQVIGMDQRGRWLFRKPAATDDKQTSGADDQTLILDPHLPDPTPRLPVWNLAIAKNVGWDRDNWPVIQNGAAFALTASDWRGLGKDEEFFTRIAPPPQAPIHSISVSTRPSSGPVINVDQASAILTEADGTRYFGGQSELKVISVNGESIDWPLPAMAVGSGPVTLIRADSGKFYLFNQPGRVLRISRNRDAGAPFTLEATFVHGIPSVKQPTRIWMDPAGRIDIVWENRLAVLFPDGFIPRAISEKMLDQSGLDAESP
jgi:hypothetical protein